MDNNKYIETKVSDAMTEKPIEFTLNGREFSIKPPTLGKMQILSKHYLLLDIDEKKLEEEPHLEAMRVCEQKTDRVCDLMAVAVTNTKDDLLDDEKLKELSEFFKWHSTPKDFGVIILAILTQVDYVNFINSIRLTRTLRLNEPKGRTDRVEKSEDVRSGVH